MTPRSFNKFYLNQLLDLPQDSDNEDKDFKIVYQDSGPDAKFDAWLYFEGNKKPYQSKELISENKEKRKIIFSNPFLAKRALTNIDVEFIAELIKHFDVYIWQGDNVPFSSCRPIASTTEFWEKQSTVVPGDSKTVMQQLAGPQGLSLDSFTILDYTAYTNVLEKHQLAKDYLNNADDFNFRRVNENISFLDCDANDAIDVYTKSLNTHDIKNVRIRNVKSYEQIIQYLEIFPNIERLNLPDFKNFDPENLKKFSTKFAKCNKIEWEYQLLAQGVNQEPGPTRIDINDDLWNLPVEHNVPYLCFNNITGADENVNAELQALNCPNLKLLSVETCDFELKTVEKIKQIEMLRIYNSKCFSPASLNQLTQLKKLYIYDKSESLADQEWDFTQLPQLEELNIDDEKILQNTKSLESIARCKKLKSLCIVGETKQIVKLPPALEELELKDTDLKNYPLSELNHIKTLKVVNVTSLEQLDFSQLKNLEELSIEMSSEISSEQIIHILSVLSKQLKRLDLSGSIDLKNFDFSIMSQLDKLSLHGVVLNSIVDFEKCQRLRTFKSNCRNSYKFPSSLENLTLSASSRGSEVKLDLSKCVHLKTMDLHYYHPAVLDLRNCHELEDVFLNGCDIQSLNLYGIKTLKNCRVHSRKFIHEINLYGCTNLQNLGVSSAALDDKLLVIEDLNLTHCSNLQKISATKTLINTIHFPEKNNSRLQTIQCTAPQLVSIDRDKLPSECNVYFAEPGIYTDANMQMDRRNDRSPTSTFDFDLDEVKEPDSITCRRRTHTANGQITLTLHTHENACKHDYRVNVFDQVSFSNDKISFTGGGDYFFTHLKRVDNKIESYPKNLKEYMQEVAPDHDVGHFEGKSLTPGKVYPLSTQKPMPYGQLHKIFCEPEDSIELFWHEEHQQYYFTPKIDSEKINILYEYNAAHHYREKPHHIKVWSRAWLLPKKLIEILDEKIHHDPAFKELQFLISDLSVDEKIQKLTEYCRDFTATDLSKKPTKSFQKLLTFIAEKKGACRHRSEAFMVLARYIGVPARMISNELHRFCEVLCGEGLLSEWHGIELGGNPDVLDLTPESKNIFAEAGAVLKPTHKESSEPQLEPQSVQQKEQDAEKQLVEELMTETIQKDEWEDQYDQIFQNLLDEKLLNPEVILNKYTVFSPLIMLSADQNPLSMQAKLLEVIKRTDRNLMKDTIYIDKPSDFELYLNPSRLKDNVREKIAGPLAEMIQNNHGRIIINWSNFNATEIASYKCILDKPPTLLGNPIPSNIHMIGMIKKNDKACNAFTSRCQRFYSQDSANQKTPREQAEEQAQNEAINVSLAKNPESYEIVDLFHSAAWRELLLGEINFQGHDIIINSEQSPLLKAIKSGKTLIIQNPPNDPAFEVLMHRIQVERRFFYNGELLEVPDNFNICFTTQNHEAALSNPNIKVSSEAQSTDDTRKRIYLGLYNLHDCFNTITINDAHQAMNSPGLLAEYQQDKQVLYITETIPLSEWEELLTNIAKKYPHQAFDFILAPGVKIQSYGAEDQDDLSIIRPAKVLSAQDALKDKTSIVFTNDTDYHCEALRQSLIEQHKVATESTTAAGPSKKSKKPLIVDITPQTTFRDLIACEQILHEKSNYQLELCKKDPGNDHILADTVYLYPKDNGFEYVAKNRLGQIERVSLPETLLRDHLPTIQNALAAKEGEKRTLSAYHRNGIIDVICKQGGPVYFSYEEKGVLKALKDGRTVILNGELSPRLYHQLLPLLNPQNPHIYSNGKRIEIPGKLIAVMPQAKHKPVLFEENLDVTYQKEDYEKLFPEQTESLNKIYLFYELSKKIPHVGKGIPDLPKLSKSRLQRMLRALQNPRIHLRNPIKGLFHYDYPKQSEEYAYLNTVAKYLFDVGDRTSASTKAHRLAELKVNINENTWQILNCLDGKTLRAIFGPDITQSIMIHPSTFRPILTQDALARLQQVLLTPITSLEKKSHVQKREEQLQTLLNDPLVPIILLKGEPGVGKTYSVRELQNQLNFKTYEGEEGILQWLNDPSDEIKALLLDEANMASPGTWDFLKGISRDKKNIYYQGKVYPLTEKHKIIATGNPENYPGRSYHPFFQHYGETLMFAIPERTYLESKILQPILSERFAHVQNDLLHAYFLIQKYNPLFEYSNRDLINLAERFIFLASQANNAEEEKQALKKACIAEFAVAIFDKAKREQFMNDLIEQLKLPTVSTDTITSSTFYLPSTKAYLREFIEQDLQMRNEVIHSDNQDRSYKKGVVLEGEAGARKSTLFKKILEENGFVNAAIASSDIPKQQQYYEISVGTQNVRDILLRAFREGSVVILDELNLDDENLEKLLNDLLTGKDPDESQLDNKGKDKIAKTGPAPGFMVFASQNPGYYEGRKSLSPALRNRMHVYYMDDHTALEQLKIAENEGVVPYTFVKSFLRAKKQFKHANMRTFFDALTECSKLMKTAAAESAPNASTLAKSGVLSDDRSAVTSLVSEIYPKLGVFQATPSASPSPSPSASDSKKSENQSSHDSPRKT